jgi:hypothetical protein
MYVSHEGSSQRLRNPYVGGNAGILIRHVWTLEFT